MNREEVAALRGFNLWAAAHLSMDRLSEAMRELIGADVDLLVGRAQPLRFARTIDHAVGVVLAHADAPAGTPGALLEAEGALAANLVARALKRPPPVWVDPMAAPSPGAAGAFAAVLAAAVRRAHGGIAMRVLAAGPAATLEADLATLDPELLALSLTVLIERDAFAARVVLSRLTALASGAPPWDARALASLGPAPLALPIVALATVATAADMATLRLGDALVPLPNRLARACGLVGPVLLAPPFWDCGVRAELGEDGRLVLVGGLEPIVAAETHMDSDPKDSVVAALGEVPVVVRVEIGEASMPAREWASLNRGDVIALGRRVGEPVTLRVGGVPLARGELVEVDGEVGVRIVERLVPARATS
jgi:type III secretion system YscQ/HrcQ family protein